MPRASSGAQGLAAIAVPGCGRSALRPTSAHGPLTAGALPSGLSACSCRGVSIGGSSSTRFRAVARSGGAAAAGSGGGARLSSRAALDQGEPPPSLDKTSNNFPPGVEREKAPAPGKGNAGAKARRTTTETNPKCPKGTIILTQQLCVLPLPARCNRWACPDCGPRNARRLRRRLERTRPQRLITLTLKPNPDLTPRELLAVANRSWSILWRRYRRKFGPRAVGYAKIVELTKAGTPHLHIIADVPFIAQRQLAAEWRALTGSYIVDIRKVRGRNGIAGYLTSYLTKALEVPAGMRKWSAARHWVPPDQPRLLEEGELPPEARYANQSTAAILAAYVAGGWTFAGSWLIPPVNTHPTPHAPPSAAFGVPTGRPRPLA